MNKSIQFAVIASTLCACAVVLAVLHFKSPHSPTPNEWRELATQAAGAYVPSGMHSCGIVGVNEDTSAAQACIQQAIRSKASFWVLSQGQGEDSEVWTLIINSDANSLRRVDFDSIGWNERGKPSFRSTPYDCPSDARSTLSVGGGGHGTPFFYCDAARE